MRASSVDAARVRRILRGLSSLADATPGWDSSDLAKVARRLSSVLAQALLPDFVHVRLRSAARDIDFEVTRTASDLDAADWVPRIQRSLSPWIHADVASFPTEIPCPSGAAAVARLAVAAVGPRGEWGFVVAGAGRPGFPHEDETAFLQLIAGQATVLLRSRQSEEALRGEREQSSAILETVGALVVVLDGEGRVVRFNRACERATGYTLADVRGKHLWDLLLGPEDAERMRAFFRSLRATVFPSRSEGYWIARGGQRRLISWTDTAIANAADDVRYVIKTGLDVTEQRDAEAQRLRLAAILDATPDFVGIVTPDQRTVYVNRAGRRMVGRGDDEDISWMTISDYHPAWALPKVLFEGFAQAIEKGVWTGETAFLGADETEIPVSQVLLAHRSAEGRVEYVSTIARDISLLARAQEALKVADQRKDEFLAMLAHELRNPLAPLRNALQILELVGHDAPTRERVLAMAGRQIDLLVRLVDDLLEVSRITRGKIAIRPELVELSAVIRQAVETCQPLIDQQAHELEITEPPEGVFVRADFTRLSQVFANLLNNACKYSPPRSRIRLTVERQGPQVAITIKDTGIGIPPEMLARIFDLFIQADRSLERSQGGLGIGLSLARGLVELHGGTLEARSEGPGKGSEFIVRLAIEGGAAAGVALGGGGAAPASHKHRVLVADDNRDAADSMAWMLRMLGNEAFTAYDGVAAVEAVRALKPDVVVLDIGMPRLNGYGAARRIRELRWGKDVYLIAMTGWGQEEDKQRSRQSGFDVHVTKPVAPSTLQALLGQRAPSH